MAIGSGFRQQIATPWIKIRTAQAYGGGDPSWSENSETGARLKKQVAKGRGPPGPLSASLETPEGVEAKVRIHRQDPGPKSSSQLFFVDCGLPWNRHFGRLP